MNYFKTKASELFYHCPANPKSNFVSKTRVISTTKVCAFLEVYTLEMAIKALKITTILNPCDTITKIKRL